MRRWLLALVAIALLLAVGIGLAAYHLDAFLDANRDAIAKQAEDALGREVAFEKVGVSLRGGLSIRVEGLTIADDPAFSSAPFLRADALEVRIRILPALRGHIEVDRVVLRSPEIAVIRTAQGLSTASLGRGPAPAPSGSGASDASGALLVALVDIEDGTIRFVDRSSRPPVETAIAQLDFRASDLAPGAPIAFEMRAALLGASRQNLRASGSVDPAADPVVDVEAELAPLDLAKALASAPLAGHVPAALSGAGPARIELRAKGPASDLALDARVDGRDAELHVGRGFAKPRGEPFALSLSGRRRAAGLEIAQGELVLGATRLALRGAIENPASPRIRLGVSSKEFRPAAFGVADADAVLRDLALDARISLPASGPSVDAKLRSPSGVLRGVEFGDLALDARMDRGRVEVSGLSLAAFGGRVAVKGVADLRGAAPSFDARVDVRGASVERLLAARGDEPPRATGSLDAGIALRGAGSSWEQIAPTLVGGGEIGVSDGVLRHFNPAGDALRALAGLPVLSDRKLARLFDSHPQVFGAEDTPFERLTARVEVAGGEITARDALLVARDYEVRGKGRFAFAGRIDSSAVMAFSPELSEAIVAAEKKLRLLRSPEGRVEFPVLIRGKPGEVGVSPDLAYVAASISREAIGGVVERALVGKRGAGAGEGAPPGDAGSEEPPASLGDVGRDLLRRGLDGILGGQRQE